jgi:diguanylate cyclase (GGDEF)-like protein
VRSKFVTRITRFLDRWISTSHQSDDLTLIRQRTLVAIVLLEVVFLPIGCAYLFFYSPLSPDRTQAALASMIPAWIWFNIVLLMMHRKISIRLCTHMVIFGLYVGVFLSFVISAPFIPSVEALLIVIPICAFCLSGRSCGVVWSFIVFVTLVTLILSDVPIRTDELSDYVDQNKSIGQQYWITSLILVAGIQLIYEHMNRYLTNKLNKDRDRYFYESMRDHLTGLANKSLFENQLDHAVVAAKRVNSLVGVVYIDLNQFKTINDKWGHKIGDQILQETAKRIETSLREYDVAARLSGDEFAIILMSLQTPGDIDTQANKFKCDLSFSFNSDKYSVDVSAAVGSALYPTQATTAESLLNVADQSMYKHKRGNQSVQNTS